MPIKPTRRLPVALSVAVGILVIASGVLWWQRQNIEDWWRLHDYNPPTAITKLASDDTMTPLAQHLFYINHPSLDDRTTFSKQCPNNGGEQTIVLGCYHPGENGIFIFNVSDPQLDGVEQVTAAHEMLHAAYARLRSSERSYIDGLIESYYKHDLTDQRIIGEIAIYKRTEPNSVNDEMHSVLGTEVANLPAPLENYYKQYFTNRQKIVGYANQYQQAFTSRQDAVANYDAQLSVLKTQISTNETNLAMQEQSINTTKAQLETALNSGNTAAYNAGVPGYNAQVDSYNSLITSTKALISQYNAMVDQRNAVALQEQQLSQELNSNLTPISTQ